ncbi:hypothetical protein BDM02DRAFT_2763750 [Thelephora ganbajun]|uniref:Uncharacterized protein n=1 Tax=Thelephora ganbajun TaxID=370292 RepID=A0ACB6ZSF5_THEGA|nr:hypothetical protein BDM02DRAFT_2763750 [Thelephora ganbajun]
MSYSRLLVTLVLSLAASSLTLCGWSPYLSLYRDVFRQRVYWPSNSELNRQFASLPPSSRIRRGDMGCLSSYS